MADKVAVDDAVDVVLGFALPTTTGGAVMACNKQTLTRIKQGFQSRPSIEGGAGN